MELRATALWMSGIGPEAEGQVEFAILLERAISGDVFRLRADYPAI